jgi:hypothetical protein
MSAPDPQRVTELVERALPLFAGQDPAVIGAALADLTAIWLASHVVRGDKAGADSLRAEILLEHVEAVRRLTAINAQQLGTDQ